MLDDVTVEYRLEALSGRRAAHVLACWGLVWLLPGATLWFEEDEDWATPVLGWNCREDVLSVTAARGLVARTRNLEQQSLRGIVSTTPSRSRVNGVSRLAWEASRERQELVAADVIQSFDVSSSSGRIKAGDTDFNVGASALTLLSGKSYTSKSVEETWKLLGAYGKTTEELEAMTAGEIDRLLNGDITVAEGKPGLRFSASNPTPRTTSGSERCDIDPLIDLLAFCGQLLVQPDQRPLISSRPRKAFTWLLNPVPLTATMIVEIHESPPAGLPWPRWTSEILPIAIGASARMLAVAENETDDGSGGPRA